MTHVDHADRPMLLERAATVLHAMHDGDPSAARAALDDLDAGQLRFVTLALAGGFGNLLQRLPADAASAVYQGFAVALDAGIADEVERGLDELGLR